MPHCMNPNGVIGIVCKAYAVVANSQAQLSGLALQFPDIACAAFGKAADLGQDSHRGRPVDSADIDSRVLRPDDFFIVMAATCF